MAKGNQTSERRPRRFLISKFLDLISIDTDERCWNAKRVTAMGYGKPIRDGKRVLTSHRAAYELLHGAIPVGMEIDHLCANRACGNPAHLEPVSHAENCRRAAERRATRREGKREAA
jgi:hypothetical protein